ncbi:carbohydrate sulfotransferase 12-like [Littorina saxatilis]|uniref:Carbohydrate sulfotransferase n=1 Tax=Littorina saxatilis TaxID=31220 RepID=A0AAN9AR27_9CAEN
MLSLRKPLCLRCRRCRCGWWQLGWRMKVVVLALVAVVLYAVTALSSVQESSDNSEQYIHPVTTKPRAFKKPHEPHSLKRSHKTTWSEGRYITDGQTRMRQRQDILIRYCSTHSDEEFRGTGGIPTFRTDGLVSKRHQLFYCPVGKIASTFLTRFLVAAEETNPVISPYAISAAKALRMRVKRSGNHILFAPLNKLVQSGWQEKSYLVNLKRVVFVRCPFQRLWSAYVDKLLSPNPYYWESWGYQAGNMSQTSLLGLAGIGHDSLKKESPTATQQPCGHDVTFSQFLRLVVASLHRQDTHVRPVTWECSPCYVDYDVIGHVETLTSDVTYLASLLGLNNWTLSKVRWDEEHAEDAIKEGVRNVFFKWSSQITECMTLEEAGKRLWRVFQIRGIISESEQFSEYLTKTLDAFSMEDALFGARSRSVRNRADLDLQRHAAFEEAYETVDAELKNNIRKLYKADFEMFGFDFLTNL